MYNETFKPTWTIGNVYRLCFKKNTKLLNKYEETKEEFENRMYKSRIERRKVYFMTNTRPCKIIIKV